MAMVECEYCGTVYDDGIASDDAISCPHCRELSQKFPEKPKISAVMLVIILFLVALAALCVFLLPNIIAIILLLMDIIAICAIASSLFTERKAYRLATTDFNAYRDYMKHEREKAIELSDCIREQQEESKRKKLEELSKLPVCPICGTKKNVRRISTLNRSASIALTGLASAKIGKQYECTYCGHFW